jgi:hypothetical protein
LQSKKLSGIAAHKRREQASKEAKREIETRFPASQEAFD